MTDRIIDLTSCISVKVRGYPAFLQVGTNENIILGPNECGQIEGKHSFHEKGIGTMGGIINPGWFGKLTIEFMVFGEIDLKKGEKIAHAIIQEWKPTKADPKP
jgi:deoxycytidine triphosphate deaminase